MLHAVRGSRHNYIGDDYIGDDITGHNYTARNYTGHNYIGHDCISHTYIGCLWSKLSPKPNNFGEDRSEQRHRRRNRAITYIGHTYIGSNYVGLSI